MLLLPTPLGLPALRHPVGNSCGRSLRVVPSPPEALRPAAGRPRRAADPNHRRGTSSRRKARPRGERRELRQLVLVPAQLGRGQLRSRWALLARGWTPKARVLLLARMRPVQERGKLLARKRAQDPKRSRQLTLVPAPKLFPQALT